MADFYDVHCHIMNLSHPNFLSFLKRIKALKYLFILSLPPIINTIIAFFLCFYASKKRKFFNILSFMEKDISDAIKSMEKKDILPLFENGFLVEDFTYDKIILIPLMIDFGQKYISYVNENIWYNETSHKAIKNQVIDLFGGMAEYFNEKKQDKKIYIFPFLGINTKNYSLEDELDEDGNVKTTGIKSLLNKYFSDYSIENINKRKKNLIKNMGKFKDIETLGNYAFAGIKLYPPLGFDPWPDDEEEKEKVKYLYSFCMKKKIPLTTHTGTGGFQTIENKDCKIIGSPKRWKEVLKNYPELKINFAHFSNRICNQRKDILSLILDYPNVYTDLSYVCFKEKDYPKVEKEIKKFTTTPSNLNKIYERILFGSDFLVNLLDAESYKSYLEAFRNTKGFCGNKYLLANKNPERFLFEN